MSSTRCCDCSMEMKQGAALTGRNRTGPPCSVGRPTAHTPGSRPPRPQCYRRRQTTTTDNRHHRAKRCWPIRRASNNAHVLDWHAAAYSYTWRCTCCYRNLAHTRQMMADPLSTETNLFLTPPVAPLTRRQLKLVSKNPGTTMAVAAAARLAINECQHQFRHRRWNCSVMSEHSHGGSIFGKILTKGR